MHYIQCAICTANYTTLATMQRALYCTYFTGDRIARLRAHIYTGWQIIPIKSSKYVHLPVNVRTMCGSKTTTVH